MQKTRISLALALASSLLMLSSVSARIPSPINAFIRIVNATPNTGSVDVYISGRAMVSNLAYHNASDYIGTVRPVSNIQIVPTGKGPSAALFSVDTTNVGNGGYYTIVLMDNPSSGPKFIAITESDDLRPMPAGKARVRVTHASLAAPYVDVTLNGALLAQHLAAGSCSDYRRVDSGGYSLQIKGEGIVSTELNVDDLRFEAGKVYNLIIVGQGNSGNAPLDLLTVSQPQADSGDVVATEPTPIPTGSNPQATPTPSSNNPQWYQLEYDPHFNPESGPGIGPIAIDAQGNGWAARLGQPTTMMRLQGGRLTASKFSFANAAIERIALSSDGNEGWAIGFDNSAVGGNPATLLLHYSNGAWTNVSYTILATGTGYSLSLDGSGHNGWASAVTPTNPPRTFLLHLVNGTWQDASSLIPSGAVLQQVATDASGQHTWAAGYSGAGKNSSLYYLKGNQLQGGSLGPGANPAVGLTLDGNGNGWALFAGQGNANLIRLHADYSTSAVSSAAFSDATVKMSAIVVNAQGNGWAFGSLAPIPDRGISGVIERIEGDKVSDWQYQNNHAGQEHIVGGHVNSLAVVGDNAWATTSEGFLFRYGTLPFPMPALVPTLGGFINPGQCFDNHHCLMPQFATYWNAHGGLRQFGLPVTDPLLEKLDNGNIYVTQYTERARFEYHPANQPPNDVELGLLGDKLAAGRQNETPFKRTSAQANPAASYFDQTGHNLIGPIKDYWLKYGGLPVFGYPVSESFQEKSPTDGKTYTVQYFERNRLEYHPEDSDPQFKVLLGLLGVQQFQTTYGLTP